MFISQVTFESAKTNEPVLKAIMKKKKSEATGVAGLLSFECWVNETPENVSYTHVVKWESREHFKVWMRASHSGKHGKDLPDDPPITKKACHYELVDMDSL
ncbi:MAG: antibiotic biosynthesis monooxygenase [Candidatus Accumulibacter sp.]|nr:antibiotic biosynthesis monooxygenase [Accumulibacter sp.]